MTKAQLIQALTQSYGWTPRDAAAKPVSGRVWPYRSDYLLLIRSPPDELLLIITINRTLDPMTPF
jgi:hypothetical protein